MKKQELVHIVSPLEPFYEQLMLPSLTYFNSTEERTQILADILLPGRKGPSLRVIDHFIVQYPKCHTILIAENEGPPVNLKILYKRMLGSTGKSFFDVFKRKHAIILSISGQRTDATLGQLIFLHWYCSLNLHVKIKDYMEDLKAHMKKQSSLRRRGKEVEKTKPVEKRKRDSGDDKSLVKRNKVEGERLKDDLQPRLHSGQYTMTF